MYKVWHYSASKERNRQWLQHMVCHEVLVLFTNHWAIKGPFWIIRRPSCPPILISLHAINPPRAYCVLTWTNRELFQMPFPFTSKHVGCRTPDLIGPCLWTALNFSHYASISNLKLLDFFELYSVLNCKIKCYLSTWVGLILMKPFPDYVAWYPLSFVKRNCLCSWIETPRNTCGGEWRYFDTLSSERWTHELSELGIFKFLLERKGASPAVSVSAPQFM